jgi:hypothetical protein
MASNFRQEREVEDKIPANLAKFSYEQMNL